MIKDDYVTFEQAKLLKEKGFPQRGIEFLLWYDEGSNLHSSFLGSDNERTYIRPTLSLVQKWLREKKGISVIPFINRRKDIGASEDNPKYTPEISRLSPSFKILNFDDYKNPDMNFDIYEEALSIGINKALELI